jgi:hypothetical protein
MLAAALEYYDIGLPVIPCNPRNKKALVGWEQYQTTMPERDLVVKWWTDWPNALIAIVCGDLSDVCLLDADSEDAKKKLFELSPDLPQPHAKTPRPGWHWYFKCPDSFRSKDDLFLNVDFKANGGLAIIPPSKRNGIPYEFLDDDFDFRFLSELPEALKIAIYNSNKFLYNNINKTSYSSRGEFLQEPQEPQEPQMTTDFFTEGRRDKDIFHAANCLIKGGCEKDFAYNLLEIIAKNCIPSFPEKEIKIKIESALSRERNREKNIAADVRELVMSTTGHILTTNVHKWLQMTTRNEMKAVNMALKRLCNEKVLEKGDRSGEYRIVDQDCKPMEWINADEKYIPLWLPLGLGDICGVLPGNILVFAGAKDAGKTAFLLNIAKENRYNYKVHYFNSEMGPSEFKMRVNKFSDVSPDQWQDVSVYERHSNFHDVVKTGEGILNIIDYMEAPDEVWKIGGWIKRIHSKLSGALAVIAIQKKIGQDLGRGAEFSMEKARLYISLDYGKAKIISCKNFKPENSIGNPRGYQCNYKLVDGCKIKKDSSWTHQIKENKNKEKENERI